MALEEYVVVLVGHGKRQSQAVADLEAFLGEQSRAFVSWLWEHLSANQSSYVDQPPVSAAKVTATDNGKNTSGMDGEFGREDQAFSKVRSCTSPRRVLVLSLCRLLQVPHSSSRSNPLRCSAVILKALMTSAIHPFMFLTIRFLQDFDYSLTFSDLTPDMFSIFTLYVGPFLTHSLLLCSSLLL